MCSAKDVEGGGPATIRQHTPMEKYDNINPNYGSVVIVVVYLHAAPNTDHAAIIDDQPPPIKDNDDGPTPFQRKRLKHFKLPRKTSTTKHNDKNLVNVFTLYFSQPNNVHL